MSAIVAALIGLFGNLLIWYLTNKGGPTRPIPVLPIRALFVLGPAAPFPALISVFEAERGKNPVPPIFLLVPSGAAAVQYCVGYWQWFRRTCTGWFGVAAAGALMAYWAIGKPSGWVDETSGRISSVVAAQAHAIVAGILALSIITSVRGLLSGLLGWGGLLMALAGALGAVIMSLKSPGEGLSAELGVSYGAFLIGAMLARSTQTVTGGPFFGLLLICLGATGLLIALFTEIGVATAIHAGAVILGIISCYFFGLRKAGRNG